MTDKLPRVPPLHPMRDLADRIMTLTREHDAYSQAYQIVNMACDHLRAVARTHEQDALLVGHEWHDVPVVNEAVEKALDDRDLIRGMVNDRDGTR